MNRFSRDGRLTTLEKDLFHSQRLLRVCFPNLLPQNKKKNQQQTETSRSDPQSHSLAFMLEKSEQIAPKTVLPINIVKVKVKSSGTAPLISTYFNNLNKILQLIHI